MRYTEHLADAAASVGSNCRSDARTNEADNLPFRAELIWNRGARRGIPDLKIEVREDIGWCNDRRRQDRD
ncbi:hypothetical protein [Agreia bicolorata]|uniref:hypothetical protein n=1 Tax=Agreia bicolorata TaxID=110935 RepID=UPI001117AB11|nr:hypothetical protein [Agreia bicolorata]